VKISEVLETTCWRGKQPEALAQVGRATLLQFMQEICGVAALDVWDPWELQRGSHLAGKDVERGGEKEQNPGVRSALFGLSLLLAAPVSAEDAGVRAELVCRAEAAPGRVLCELKYTANAGARLVWADALVTSAPDFVKPLRARVAPERFKGAAPGERKLTLAFVAAKAGVGQVIVKARAVVCRGEGERESCRPESQDARAEIRVGG